jgi:hemerythrin superfamily protein
MMQNRKHERCSLLRTEHSKGIPALRGDRRRKGRSPMNALELLKQDHQRISDLFADAKNYTDMRRLFESIKSELEAHAHMEESIFYPEYQNKDILKDLVEDARTQHNLIKELLHDLENQDGPEFENSFQTLMAEVQLHFTAEENEIFPHVRSLVDGPDLGELGEELETDKIEYQLVHGS